MKSEPLTEEDQRRNKRKDVTLESLMGEDQTKNWVVRNDIRTFDGGDSDQELKKEIKLKPLTEQDQTEI